MNVQNEFRFFKEKADFKIKFAESYPHIVTQ